MLKFAYNWNRMEKVKWIMQLRKWEKWGKWLILGAKIHWWAHIETWKNSYHNGETRIWKVRRGKASQIVLLKYYS